jgi:tetratricopeptide (TPR) repeat protein
MQRISGATPGERSLIHATGAALSEIDGRWDEAESEFRQAAAALASAGREHSAESASLLAGLATVYVNEGHYPQALAIVDQGLKVLETATDAVPLDRIKFLNLRGVIMARQDRWREAEADFADAFSLARAQSQIDSLEVDGLVENYVATLRKAHRQRDAKSVLAWAATLHRSASGGNQIVDVTELLRSADRKAKDK